MALPDAPETILARAVALELHEAGLGLYRPSGPAFTGSEHGILIDQAEPTTFDNCTIIRPLRPVAEGRANMLYRLQLHTRTRGTRTELRALAHAIRSLFDQQEGVPAVLGISWSEEYSRIDYGADSAGRHAVGQNLSFRGRRGE